MKFEMFLGSSAGVYQMTILAHQTCDFEISYDISLSRFFDSFLVHCEENPVTDSPRKKPAIQEAFSCI